jgi:hypothetical protein
MWEEVRGYTCVWTTVGQFESTFAPGLNGLRKNSDSQAGLEEDVPQGLKPRAYFAVVAARLKSCPDTKAASFPDTKAASFNVRGFPPLRQKQERRKDGAPRLCG